MLRSNSVEAVSFAGQEAQHRDADEKRENKSGDALSFSLASKNENPKHKS
jgi:hypothetical protein